MKPWLYCVIAFLAVVAAPLAQTNAPANPRLVYVIPVDSGIERTMVQTIERGIQEARGAKADAIVLDMNTPGGRLNAAEEIITLLLDTEIPTYTFVNTWAISAGAMIAMATDHIYMKHSGLIGDAMPILLSPIPGQGPVQLPDDLKEKVVSPTEAMIRRAAQQKGHDPKLAACMVRRELEYKIGDEVICAEGQILTLTSADAARKIDTDDGARALLSEGTVGDLDNMLTEAGLGNATVKRIDNPTAITFARFIQSQFVTIIVLGLGALLIYVEFKIPGFGLPGVAGICLIGLWFWAHHVVGLAGLTELLLLGLGLVLLMIELFVIPGFGITGVTGLILILAALGMAMVEMLPQSVPGLPEVREPIDWRQLQFALTNLGASLVLSFVSMAILARYLPETTVFKKLMLTSSLDTRKEQKDTARNTDLVGQHGTTETQLHPAGIGLFDGRRVNVVSEGDFIDKGAAVVVTAVHGNRIVVAAEGPGPETGTGDGMEAKA